MGAVTVSSVKQGSAGDKEERTATVTFSASYSTGGDTINELALGLHRIDDATVLTRGDGVVDHGYQVTLAGPPEARTLRLVRRSATNTVEEVPAATNVSTVAVRMRFRGD